MTDPHRPPHLPPPHLPPEAPPGDPLARRTLPTAGVHVGRVAGAAAALLAVGLVGYVAAKSNPSGPTPARTVEVSTPATAPPPLRYDDLPRPAPAAAPPPRLREEVSAPFKATIPTPTASTPQPDHLAEQARSAGVGGWTRPTTGIGRTAADDANLSPPIPPSQPTGSVPDHPAHPGCTVPAGTPIPLQSLNRVVTEQGGVLVAMVTRDVWGDGLTCRVIPAGSTVTMNVAPVGGRGHRRIAITDPVITRPWPNADTLRPQAVAADPQGAAGLPGRVDVPWLQTGLLIAAGTAQDLATAALTRGSPLGSLLSHTADRPLDQAARAQLERLPVITLEAGAGMVLLLKEPSSVAPTP